VSEIDWDRFDLEELAEGLRESTPGPDAERMIWAFERALVAARADEQLLDYLLAACTCLVAAGSGRSPREVLETYFRRSIPDEVWRDRYLPLFA
jgi:hypothetical protein